MIGTIIKVITVVGVVLDALKMIADAIDNK